MEENNLGTSKIEEEKIQKLDEEIIQEKKNNLIKFLKEKYLWISYFILGVIIYISLFIRTRNINNLKDITTSEWTLGPDLDPFLFLRWAEYIVENGKLFLIDNMRYIPLGYNTFGESRLLSYMIAWFHNFLSMLPEGIVKILPGKPSEITITYSAVIFPVFMFGLTIIAFFLLTREIFKDSFKEKIYPNSIALVASFFLSTIPIILPRTIAGIPEKESVGFLFIFLSFYFLIKSFKSKNYKKIITYGIIAGISTAILGLIWGGIIFVFYSTGIAVFIIYILGKMNKNMLLAHFTWIITFMPIIMYFSTRYPLKYFTSITLIPIYATLLFSIVDIYFYEKLLKINYIKILKDKFKIPKQFLPPIISIPIILVLMVVFFGFEFIKNQFLELYNNLINPITRSRFIQTVAENKQPFFTEWIESFGPQINGIPIFFLLFLIGSIVLFYNLIKNFEKKERKIFCIAYIVLILGISLTRYSPTSTLNGNNLTSNVLYLGSILSFFILGIYIIFKYNKENKKELLPDNFAFILLFSFLFISIFSARSGVRFMMVLAPSMSIMASFVIINSIKNYFNKKIKTIYLIIIILLIASGIHSLSEFYKSSIFQASVSYPSSYNQQWQKAMHWVRENTNKNAVFSHWWDYGYWVQSIGRRATVLDGGNVIGYWNHLMGRHVLTAPDDKKALEFMYAHNTTHLLIDSTDIGKYPAFSSIGADENYDRFSFIPTFFLDEKYTNEMSNGSIIFYSGGINIDEDIIFNNNGSEMKIAKENSGIVGILIFEDKNGTFYQPKLIVLNGGNQINIPLRYIYYKGKLTDYNSGYEAGVFIMETLSQKGEGLIKNDRGALLYLSKRTINSLLVRKYLFGEEGNFKLVHTEPNLIISQIKAQGLPIGEFVYLQGNFLGPIKIWEIEYPENMKINPDFLITYYPDERLR